LVPNYALRKAIEAWREERQQGQGHDGHDRGGQGRPEASEASAGAELMEATAGAGA
jgi:hypothetical protein